MKIWASVLVMLVSLVACAEVGPIDRQQSMLSIDVPDSMFANLQRSRRWEGQSLIEEWSWRHGELYVDRADRASYYQNDYSDSEDLIEDIATWPALVASNVTVNRRKIRTSRNSIGEFLYAISEIDNRGDRCFVMLQGIPYSAGASFEAAPSPEASDGFISMYECRPSAAMTAQELEDRVLTIAESMRYTR